MLEHIQHPLPHGITLDCLACGHPGKPLLLFLHGFPEGAFIWSGVMSPFADRWRCVAPNLRGYGLSSRPVHTEAYRPKHVLQDLCALITRESPGQPAACVIGHDWGGALAWNLAIQHPALLQQLLIINAPHPGAFLRELQTNPAQQAASQYMHFLRRADAPALLQANAQRRLWDFFRSPNGEWPAWLTPELQATYRAQWQQSLDTACHYYSASPLVPPRGDQQNILQLQLPAHLLHTSVPTHLLWGLADTALQPSLLDGLDAWVPHLHTTTVPEASHWLVHEQPDLVIRTLHQVLHAALLHRTRPAQTASSTDTDFPLDY